MIMNVIKSKKLMYFILQTMEWIKSFLDIKTLEGHQRKNVTSYMHIP